MEWNYKRRMREILSGLAAFELFNRWAAGHLKKGRKGGWQLLHGMRLSLRRKP
jgi:hypothetical protein